MADTNLTWGDDEQTRKKLRASLLDNPEQKVYPEDSMGAFKPQEGLSGPFIKQDPDGTFRNANQSEMSSIFDPSFKGKTVDVLRGMQLSRYGYNQKTGEMEPVALSPLEMEENRSRRDARLLSAALNAPADETSNKEYRSDGSIKSESSSFRSNIPSFLQQVDVFRTPELNFQANRENNARMIQQEGMQQSGANARAAITDKKDRKWLTQEETKGIDSNYESFGTLLDEIVAGTHNRITDDAAADTKYNNELRRRALELKKNMPMYQQQDKEAVGTGSDTSWNFKRATSYLNSGTDFNKKPTLQTTQPTFDQWKAEIKKRGSKMTDQQLDAYYRQNYGR